MRASSVTVAGNFTFARVGQTVSQTLLIHVNARRTLSPPKWQLASTMLMYATGCVSRSVSLPSLYPRLFWRLQVFPRASLWFKLRGVYFLSGYLGWQKVPRRFHSADIFWHALQNCRFSPRRLDRYVLSLHENMLTWYALRQRNISTNIYLHMYSLRQSSGVKF